ncbi:hypothetical protein SHKM778_19290 [Streptomyces sp. KM77-8]|uniref:Aminotransferase class V domain-containing protein n=1 Tax=Streptomyces haneummycinicus TaxID=3074435 RepID=A0AAT9HDS0_9ACTN
MAYLDHAATTPMLPEAVEALTAHLGVTGNASSLHAAGRRARRTVEEARETLAESLGARPSEIVLTSGGTEADNLAVKGLYWSRRDADPARTRVLASPVEHHAVLDAVHWLGEHEGATVEYLPVDAYGRVHPETLREAIARDPDDVALATVMWANNEIGTILPVRELAEAAAEFGVPLHSDAVQAFGQVPVDFAASGLAAMTVSGHKIGGPYGIGALVLGREHTPYPYSTAAARNATSVPAPSTSPPSPPSRPPDGSPPNSGSGSPARSASCATTWSPRSARPSPTPSLAATPPRRTPSGQRALHLPRLRGRLPAPPPGRPGHRLLHRLRLHRRCRPAQPCPPGHRVGPRPRPRHPPLLPRPHLYGGRRGGRGQGHRPGGGTGQGGGADVSPVDSLAGAESVSS